MTSARSDKEPPPVHGESGGEPSDGEKHRDDGDALSRVHGVVVEVELHGTCARRQRRSLPAMHTADRPETCTDTRSTRRNSSPGPPLTSRWYPGLPCSYTGTARSRVARTSVT